jgi:hypothetical protein
MKSAIEFLDPEIGIVDIGRARAEIRDALQHYIMEKEIFMVDHANNISKK